MKKRMNPRAVPAVRKALGMRLRALRKERGFSQEKLGEKSGLSGKFIGEVERFEKSISIDSLWRVAKALDVPLRELTNLGKDQRPAGVREEMERVRALIANWSANELGNAHGVLKVMFGSSGRGRGRRHKH